MPGRTVRIYMADGSPFGIRQAEIFNRTIQALGVSRLRVGELAFTFSLEGLKPEVGNRKRTSVRRRTS